MKTIALLSLLAEPSLPGPLRRTFRGEPVLAWTLRRLARVEGLPQSTILAWDDQLSSLQHVDAAIQSCGPRRNVGRLESIAAAQRWSDGWRGGLLQSAPFDVGFAAKPAQQALIEAAADGCLIVGASDGLVDPAILRSVIDAASNGTREFYFSAAAPGLGGVLVKRSLIDRMAHDGAHPGRLLHYLPEAPVVDPLISDACVAVPLPVCRTTRRFTLDSERQIRSIEQATLPLNGTLMSSEAETLVQRVAALPVDAVFPREVTIELTTRRATRPTYTAASHLSIDRADMSAEGFAAIVEQLQAVDDVRITLGGVGDPLLHPQIAELLPMLRELHAVHVETDLVGISEVVLRSLVDARVDVVSVSLPAATPATYQRIMGVDAMAGVLENIRKLLLLRQSADGGVPVIAPRFVKLVENFAEMEQWHDTWLRALGSAVIAGPSTFGGRVADLGVADMTPPTRRPCSRIAGRMTILSDGRIVSCEEDVLGEQPMGQVISDTIADVWQRQFDDLRQRHKSLTSLPVICTACKEWHRP